MSTSSDDTLTEVPQGSSPGGSQLTNGTEDTLNFHPDFASSVIFRTSDNVCFRYSLDALARHSTFFRNLVELDNVVTKTEQCCQIIDLYSAKASGLAFAFRLLNKTESYSIDCPDNDVLDNFIDIVKAYDLGEAARNLLTGYVLKASGWREELRRHTVHLVISSLVHLPQDRGAWIAWPLLVHPTLDPWARGHLQNHPRFTSAVVKVMQQWAKQQLILTTSVLGEFNSSYQNLQSRQLQMAERNLCRLLELLPRRSVVLDDGENFIDNSLSRHGRTALREEFRVLHASVCSMKVDLWG